MTDGESKPRTLLVMSLQDAAANLQRAKAANLRADEQMALAQKQVDLAEAAREAAWSDLREARQILQDAAERGETAGTAAGASNGQA